MSDAAWLSEAVVEFLKGPLYINPLMSFIDERCLIFTPDEENKLEYTTIHNDFKELVDKLLTDFLAQLGVGPEEFFKVVSAAQETDRLTSFVVQTILTVDDFLMFKAMMVRRNIDLTSQVLDAVEQAFRDAEESADVATAVAGSVPSLTSRVVTSEEEEEVLREAMELSNRLHSEWTEVDALQKAMRTLQLEDEDVALPLAIALSLREHTKYDSELADIELAIALSMALDEERRRLTAEAQAGDAKSPAAKAAGGAAGSPAAKPAAGAAAKPAASEPTVIAKAAPAPAAALPPVKAAPSAAAPPAPAAAAPAAAASPSAAAAPARPGKFVPAPIDAPTGVAGRPRGRAAGYKSDASPVDLEAIRKAAQQAAESQKKLIGKGDANDEASKWLQEAKKKLVAQKQADREQEIEAYKAAAKPAKAAGAGAGPSPDEAKRAALREALAQKMKQSILQQQS